MGQYHTKPNIKWILWILCFEACNSYYFYICRVEPSEKIMILNENEVNQKDSILLKPFLSDNRIFLFFFFFFLIWIYSVQRWTATTKHKLQEKKAQKD